MDCMSQEITLFENEDWRLIPSGLEYKDNGYFIGADQIGDMQHDGSWFWPGHMAEKLWCDPVWFEHAFAQALAVSGPRTAGISTFKWAAHQRAVGDAIISENLPRRLGEIASGQLAALEEQLFRRVEMDQRSRTDGERRQSDSTVATPCPLRRAA